MLGSATIADVQADPTPGRLILKPVSVAPNEADGVLPYMQNQWVAVAGFVPISCMISPYHAAWNDATEAILPGVDRCFLLEAVLRAQSSLGEGDKIVSIAARIEHWRRDHKTMLRRLERINREWLSSVDYVSPAGQNQPARAGSKPATLRG